MNFKYLYLANRIALLCLISIVFQYTLPNANAARPPCSFEVETAYEAPGGSGHFVISGIAWDGNNLWSCRSTNTGFGKIYKHNMDLTLSVQSEYNSPGELPSGLTWDGQNLWSFDGQRERIYKHNMDLTLSVQSEYDLSGGPPIGAVAWDGQNLWSSADGKFRKHNMDSTLSIAFETDSIHGTSGLSFSEDGKNIWTIDLWGRYSGEATIIRHNLDSSSANTYMVPESGRNDGWTGLAWDNNYLWVCNRRTEPSGSKYSEKAIYKLKAIRPDHPSLNEYVTFDHNSSIYTFTSDTAGCPDGCVGKFRFDANLANISDHYLLTNLLVEIAELTNDNLILTDTGLIGKGNGFDVPENNDYTDGILGSGEDVNVPFTVCLKNKDPFRFFVDVYGGAGDTDPAKITVMNTNDSGSGSLRQSIAYAISGGEIVFDPSLSGQTITLTCEGLLIDKDLTITGLGEDNLVISGDLSCQDATTLDCFFCDGIGKILQIESGAVVTISELTITEGGKDTESVGGIRNDGTLTINSCTISRNRGSGIINNGMLTINNSTISENQFYNGGNGSGIFNNGKLTINNSTISGNRTHCENLYIFERLGAGGGISNGVDGTLTINNSTISGNSSSNAGGIRNDGKLTINNSTISENGVSQEFSAGGGIFNSESGNLTISNSTISGNEAEFGGGIQNHGKLTITYSTISENGSSGISTSHHPFSDDDETGTIELQNIILAGNTGDEYWGNGADCDIGGEYEVISLGNNLFGPSCTFTLQDSDLVGCPRLGPLADNGGPTFTHALLEGSPAIDAGSIDLCPSTDQRNLERPMDGDGDGMAVCDIGSFEFYPGVDDLWVWLGDIPGSASVGWDKYRVDQSWYQSGFDVAGIHYDHGVFTPAPAHVSYNLEHVTNTLEDCRTAFSACVGLEDGDGNCGDGVIFRVNIDDQDGNSFEIYKSNIILSGETVTCFSLPLNGSTTLDLFVDELGDNGCDEAVWVNAKLITDVQDLNNGLIASYPFNGNTNDESGNGKDGIVYGASLAEDRFGNPQSAYIFNIDDYVDCGNNILHAFTNWTIHAWINCTGQIRPHQDIYTEMGTNCGDRNLMFSLFFGNLMIYLDTYGIDDQHIIGTSNLIDSKWHQVVATKNGNKVKLYVDTVIEKEDVTSRGIDSELSMRIGRSEHVGLSALKGRIDDLRIYNRALSEAEIKALYNLGK